MTRQDAIHALHRALGTQTAIDLVNELQSRGYVSDNVIEPKEVATADLITAAEEFMEIIE